MIATLAGSLLSGALVCLAFPKWNLAFLAWFALVPLLLAAVGGSFRKAFAVGTLAGWTAFCGILYWIVPTFQAANVPTGLGVASVALLAGYIALYYGTFAALSALFFARLSQTSFLLGGAALWAALEFLRNYLLTGFPWALLGASQWRNSALLPLCRWTGVYGISALLVLANLFIFIMLRKKTVKFSPLLLFVLAGIAAALAAPRFLNIPREAGKPLRVALLQGNIDQYKKWSRSYVQEILDAYGGLSERAARGNPDLIVWPETALPGWMPQDAWLAEWMGKTVGKSGRPHLAGAVTQEGSASFNSAFLFAPDGKIAARYDKIHLVPFGEFVPLDGVLSRWIAVLNQLGGFQSGREAKLLDAPGARLGVSVCYESIFPEIFRNETREGAQVLVNLTNDGWYLDSAAPEQHFSMNVFRAAENGRTLVRAANTGISAIIGPDGSIVARTRLGERTLLEGAVVPRKSLTFYSRYGDLFAWLCCAAAALAVLAAIVKGEK